MAAAKAMWEKPELIVLVRSRPEEAVLVACKSGGMLGPDDVDPLKNCKYRGANCSVSSKS